MRQHLPLQVVLLDVVPATKHMDVQRQTHAERTSTPVQRGGLEPCRRDRSNKLRRPGNQQSAGRGYTLCRRWLGQRKTLHHHECTTTTAAALKTPLSSKAWCPAEYKGSPPAYFKRHKKTTKNNTRVFTTWLTAIPPTIPATTTKIAAHAAAANSPGLSEGLVSLPEDEVAPQQRDDGLVGPDVLVQPVARELLVILGVFYWCCKWHCTGIVLEPDLLVCNTNRYHITVTTTAVST